MVNYELDAFESRMLDVDSGEDNKFVAFSASMDHQSDGVIAWLANPMSIDSSLVDIGDLDRWRRCAEHIDILTYGLFAYKRYSAGDCFIVDGKSISAQECVTLLSNSASKCQDVSAQLRDKLVSRQQERLAILKKQDPFGVFFAKRWEACSSPEISKRVIAVLTICLLFLPSLVNTIAFRINGRHKQIKLLNQSRAEEKQADKMLGQIQDHTSKALEKLKLPVEEMHIKLEHNVVWPTATAHSEKGSANDLVPPAAMPFPTASNKAVPTTSRLATHSTKPTMPATADNPPKPVHHRNKDRLAKEFDFSSFPSPQKDFPKFCREIWQIAYLDNPIFKRDDYPEADRIFALAAFLFKFGNTMKLDELQAVLSPDARGLAVLKKTYATFPYLFNNSGKDAFSLSAVLAGHLTRAGHDAKHDFIQFYHLAEERSRYLQCAIFPADQQDRLMQIYRKHPESAFDDFLLAITESHYFGVKYTSDGGQLRVQPDRDLICNLQIDISKNSHYKMRVTRVAKSANETIHACNRAIKDDSDPKFNGHSGIEWAKMAAIVRGNICGARLQLEKNTFWQAVNDNFKKLVTDQEIHSALEQINKIINTNDLNPNTAISNASGENGGLKLSHPK